jgi:hypothetical protein
MAGCTIFLVLLALDWAALHDIIKGDQDVWMEWPFVLFSLILLIVVIHKWLNNKTGMSHGHACMQFPLSNV